MTERDPAVLDVLERTRPRPAEGADWDDVLRRTTSQERRPVSRRPMARVMRWAPGLAGGVAIAAVLGVLVVRQGDAPPSAAPKGVTGVEALVRVTSIREGQTDEQAAERMERVLTDRARIQGITGFAIERSGAELSVFVPRTQNPDWVRQWIGVVPSLRVVDGRGGIVSSGFDPIAVARAVEVRDEAGPVVFYRALRDTRRQASYVVGPYATRSEAGEGARAGGPQQTLRIVAVAAGASLTMRMNGERIRFEARRDGLIAPGDVISVEARGPRVALTLGEQARATVTRGLSGSFIVPALEELAAGIFAPLADWDPVAGVLWFRAKDVEARRLAYVYAGGQADALTTTMRAARVGPVPTPRGLRVRVPDRLKRAAQGPGGGLIRWETYRRAVAATSARGTWWVWTADATAGWSTAGVASPGGGWSFGGCDVDPARPVVAVCGGGWERPRRTRVVFGRAGDGVRRVTVVSRDGTSTEARVANGFYIALVPIRSGRLSAIVAGDARGRELARITSEDPLWGPTL